MVQTPNRGYESPAEYADPWYVPYLNQWNQVDGDVNLLYQRVNNVVNTIGTVEFPGDLRQIRGVPGALALAKGRLSAEDGAGGIFFWVVGSAVDDGAIVVIPTGSPPPSGYWRRLYDGPINARWYGFHPSASGPDNVAALTAAIAAASTGQQGIMFMPAGQYPMDGTILVNIADQYAVTVQGAGRQTILDFSSTTGEDCLYIQQAYRSTFRDFKILGPASRTTRGIRMGDEIGGYSASDNQFYNVESRQHGYALYTEGGVTNRFVSCEFSISNYAIRMTAQSNVFSFVGCYFLQNSMWFYIIKSNATFLECTFQRIVDPVQLYGFWSNDSEIRILGSYFEKKDDSIALGLVQSSLAGNTLPSSLVWDGGHITPDGNSIIRFSGQPQISLRGMNNSIGPLDLTRGLCIGPIAANDYGLYNPVFAPTDTAEGRVKPKLLAKFGYGENATQAEVVAVNEEYAVLEGEIVDAVVTAGKAYTVEILAKQSDDSGTQRLYLDVRGAGGRIERREIANIPRASGAWEPVYLPLIAPTDESNPANLIEVETLVGEQVRVKRIRILEGTYFAHVDPEYRERIQLNAPPTSLSWQKGDLVLSKAATRSGAIGWSCIASGDPGAWKEVGGERPVTVTSDSTYNVVASEWAIFTTRPAAGACSIRIPSSFIANARAELLVKDWSGNAGTPGRQIVIETVGTETIDGVDTATIDWNYGALLLKSDGSNLAIIGKY